MCGRHRAAPQGPAPSQQLALDLQAWLCGPEAHCAALGELLNLSEKRCSQLSRGGDGRVRSLDGREDQRRGFEVDAPGPRSCRVCKSEQLFKAPRWSDFPQGEPSPRSLPPGVHASCTPPPQSSGTTTHFQPAGVAQGGVTPRVNLHETLTPTLSGDTPWPPCRGRPFGEGRRAESRPPAGAEPCPVRQPPRDRVLEGPPARGYVLCPASPRWDPARPRPACHRVRSPAEPGLPPTESVRSLVRVVLSHWICGISLHGSSSLIQTLSVILHRPDWLTSATGFRCQALMGVPSRCVFP